MESEKTLEDFLKEYDSFTYSEIEDLFEEFLDECYEPAELAGMTIYASEMKTIDPVMFRCGVSDWASEEFTENGYDEYYRASDYENAENEYQEYLDELENENE